MTSFNHRYSSLRADGVGGPEGLILSVIATAVLDIRGSDKHQRNSAMRYFTGPVYQHHLSLLDLPGGWLPEGVHITDTRRAHVGVE